MSSNCEELLQLAEAIITETDTEKLLRLSKQLLDALARAEAEKMTQWQWADASGVTPVRRINSNLPPQ